MGNPFIKPVRSRSNTSQSLRKLVATLLARTLQTTRTLEPSGRSRIGRPGPYAHASLYSTGGGRKYLNATERRSFLDAAKKMPPSIGLFCMVIMWSGCRLSEALSIVPAAIDLDAGTLSLETLKKRKRGIVRQVPLPPAFICDLDRVFDLRARQKDSELATIRIWSWSRSTAWRQVKKAMKAAGIVGGAAMPKGLRHAFGVTAFATVPPHIVQRWLGHSSLRTTAIYGDVSGQEEQAYAMRLWRHW